MAQRKPGVKGAVDADDLPRAAAALFHDCLFLRPDAPEGGELPIRMFRFHFGMFAEAEDRICQRAPVGARADDFEITTHFAFVAQQQGDIVTAMAQVEPQRRLG